MSQPAGKVKVPEEVRGRVKEVCSRDTPARVARRWEMNPDTLARVLAGYEVNRGTLAQVRLGLQEEAT